MRCRDVRERKPPRRPGSVPVLAVLAVVASVAFCLSSGTQPASAQAARQAQAPADATPPGYAALIDDALIEYEALHFEEARALFAKAHALYPNARTLRGLGMVEFELRAYAASADYLQQALASTTRPLTGALRESTSALLARAHGFVGELTIELRPSSAELRLDGAAVALEPGKPIALNVGDHVIEARSDGYASARQKVEVRGGERQRLQLNLAPDAAVTAAASSSSASATTQPGPGPGALPWVLVGVGGALMIGGGVLLAIAQSDINQVEGASKGAAWADSADAYDASPLESGLGFALLGVGAAGVVGGLVWGSGGSRESDESAKRAGAIRVALDPQRIRVTGSF